MFNIFKANERVDSRIEDYEEIMSYVDKINNYPNRRYYETLLEKRQVTQEVKKEDIETLNSRLRESLPEDLQKILDEWLIETEELVPVLASIRNFHGLKTDDEGLMSYPSKQEHSENIPETEKEESGELARQDYILRMKSVRNIFGELFVKEKLDNLYSDEFGGPGFELRLSDFEESIKDLNKQERIERITDFLDTLR